MKCLLWILLLIGLCLYATQPDATSERTPVPTPQPEPVPIVAGWVC